MPRPDPNAPFSRTAADSREARLAQQAEMLGHRVAKTARRLQKWAERQGIGAYRLYDWDIPEIRLVIDWYEGNLHVAEYARRQTDEWQGWLEAMAQAAGAALGVPNERLFLKRRHTGAGTRYGRLARAGERIAVREQGLRFWVNLSDRIDTGLFADHRKTRAWVRELARDCDFLNLYGYTGTFTCYAAAGEARTTTTVDLSGTYLAWARDNLELNGLSSPRHEGVQADARAFLASAAREGRRFTLAVVDPPSFSTDRKGAGDFDVQRDHRALVLETLQVMAPGGIVFFSTNHQRFAPDLEGLPVSSLEDVTRRSIPEDFRNPQVHRCWRIVAR